MDLQKPNQNETSNPYSGYEQVSGGYSVPPKREKKTGFAITALILGVISLLGFCCCLNVITAPLAIVFGGIALAKRHDGTGLSIMGILCAVLSIVIVIAGYFSVREIMPYSEQILTDYIQLCNQQDTVFPAYKEDKTLPDYMEKYKESPYTEFMDKYDMDIYDVMDVLLDQYEHGQLQTYDFSMPESSSSSESEASTMPAGEPVI